MEATHNQTHDRAAHEHPDQLQRVFFVARRALSGRYRFTVLLAIMLALIGGVWGSTLSSPQYSSTGLLRVAPTLPKLLYSNEQNQLPAAYASMVAAHATLLARPDFLEHVVSDLDPQPWAEWGPSDRLRDLVANTEVLHRRGDEVVSITVTGRNPAQVRDAVNAILHAHLAEQTSLSQSSSADIDSQLGAREDSLEQEADQLEHRLLDLAGPYGGPDMLQRLHDSRLHELQAIGERLLSYGVDIDAPSHPPTFYPSASATAEPSDTIEDIAAIEQRLAALKDERDRLESQIAIHSRTLGPRHRTMLDLRARLSAVHSLIHQAQIRVDERSLAMAPVIASLQAQHAALTAEAAHLGRTLQEVASLRDQHQRRLERLAETSARREELRVEASREQPTRVSIAAPGPFPSSPSSDRRAAASVAGALLGAALGLGMVVLYGSLDRRCRSTADAMALTRDIPLLGVVPELKPHSSWLQQQAASGVHQIRNVLQIGSADASIRTYCITSPGPNEGKTSVALALAVSFAQSGQRTLVIDADLHGRGATQDLQMTDRAGLRDAIALEDHIGCLHQGPVPDLFVMPAGRRFALNTHRLSAAALSKLLRSLRDRYDAIIVDTAPLLGGPEAAAISALADAVVLTVSRNCDGKTVAAAQLRLRQVGARYVGLVFNRATETDFQRSSSCDQYIPHRASQRDRAKVSAAVESLREVLTSPLADPSSARNAA